MSENKHHGSSFESFRVEEGTFDEVVLTDVAFAGA
jgi:hypothetical protein